MTTRDGDDDLLDDTKALSQMRQLWSELPDEEPPARGLEALMAAARSKAVEMAPAPVTEPWWRRALAMLTRPPVLAAATVVVLVGSAAVLSRHDSLAPAPSTSNAVTPEAAPERSPAPAAATVEQKRDKARGDTVEATTAGAGQGKAPPTPPRPRPPIVEPKLEANKPEEKPAEKPTAPLEIADEQGLDGDNLKAGKSLDAPKPQVVRPPATADAEVAHADGTRGVDQLVKDAEAAARRNDCPAVKATAARIRTLDVRTYQTRVASQPAIKRCL